VLQYEVPERDGGGLMNHRSYFSNPRTDRVVGISCVDTTLVSREILEFRVDFSHFNMFKNLIRLEVFPNVDDTSIQKIIPSTKLRTLRVHGNQGLTGVGVDAIVRRFPNLEVLDLTCECTDRDLSSLTGGMLPKN